MRAARFKRVRRGRKSLAWMQAFCRIGYHLTTTAWAAKAQSVAIYKGEKFSDHAPVTVDYAL